MREEQRASGVVAYKLYANCDQSTSPSGMLGIVTGSVK